MSRTVAAYLTIIVLLSPTMGCFSPDQESALIPEGELNISPDILVGAQLQDVTLTASIPMSIHIPYLIYQPETNQFVNGTTIDFDAPGDQTIQIMTPSNLNSTYFLLGQYGRQVWAMRETNFSWSEWFSSNEFLDSPYTYIEHPTLREIDEAHTNESGARHSTGLISGLNVYQWLEIFSDPDSGYNDRWGPFTIYDPTYMRAVDFMQSELEGMGYDSQIHRYWISDFSYACLLYTSPSPRDA